MGDLIRADLEAELEPHYLEDYKFTRNVETAEKVEQLINLLKDVEVLEDIWTVALAEGHQLALDYQKEKNKENPDEEVLTKLQHRYNFIAKLDTVASIMLSGINGNEGFGWQGEHKNIILYKISQIEKLIKEGIEYVDASLSDILAEEMLAGQHEESNEEEKNYYFNELDYYEEHLKHLKNYKKSAKLVNKVFGRGDY